MVRERFLLLAFNYRLDVSTNFLTAQDLVYGRLYQGLVATIIHSANVKRRAWRLSSCGSDHKETVHLTPSVH
jgi:hypothetical protein